MPTIKEVKLSNVKPISTLPALKQVEPRAKYYREYIKGHSTLLFVSYHGELLRGNEYYKINDNYYTPLFTNPIEYWKDDDEEIQDEQLSLF